MELLQYSDDEEESAAAPAASEPSVECVFLPSPGQLACLVYLEVQGYSEGALLAHCMEGFQEVYGSKSGGEAAGGQGGASAMREGLQLPSSCLHVSVSRPFALREHFVAPLRERLQRGLASSALGSFTASLERRAVFVNEARTAAFLALELSPQPLALVGVVDGALEAFGAPPMYSPARLHASIAMLPSLPSPAQAAQSLVIHYAPTTVPSASAPAAATAAAAPPRASTGTPVDHYFLPLTMPPRQQRHGKGGSGESGISGGGGGDGGGACEAAGGKRARLGSGSSCRREVESLGLRAAIPPLPSAPISFLVTHVLFRAGRDTFKLPLR